MRNFFIVLSLLVATNGFSQAKDTLAISDSTEFICIKDMNAVLLEIGEKVSHNDFMKIQASFQVLFDEASKRKKGKKSK